MLDCRPMNELRLRFSDGDQPDLVVGGGVHALGRLPTGLGPVDGEESWLLRVSRVQPSSASSLFTMCVMADWV